MKRLTHQPYGRIGDASTNRGNIEDVEPKWLNAREDRAWSAFIHAHHQIEAYLNRRLQASGLSGPDYSVLAALSALDTGRMPAHALCNALGWEKSRLSHQIRRMQTDGLISREPNPDDARSTIVCLLPAGRGAIEKAAPGHVDDVRRNFVDLFTPAELDVLAALNERVLHHLDKDDDSRPKSSARSPHRACVIRSGSRRLHFPKAQGRQRGCPVRPTSPRSRNVGILVWLVNVRRTVSIESRRPAENAYSCGLRDTEVTVHRPLPADTRTSADTRPHRDFATTNSKAGIG